MASPAFQGILSGFGEAYTKHNQNILTMEIGRRKQLADTYEKIAQSPLARPEAMQEFMKRALVIRQHPYDKKLPKELENPMDLLIHPQAPEFPAQTEKAQGPAGTGAEVPIAPPKPPDSISPFYDPEELRGMKYREGLDEAELAGARERFVQAAKPPVPLEHFPFGYQSSGIAERATGKVTREPGTAPLPSDTSTTETELAMRAVQGDAKAKEAWDLIQKAKQDVKPEQMEPGSYIPLTNPAGQVIGAWNPKSGQYVETPIEGARRYGVSPGVNQRIADYENSVRKINDLAAAYRPEFVGPYEGRYELSKASGILSYLPFFRTPEGYGEFLSLNADLKNSIIKLVTGAQMGVQEAERILKQVPVETDKDEIWKAKYTQTQKNAEFLLNKIKELQGMSGAPTPPGGEDGGGGEAPEGTIITNGQQRMIKRNGQWEPM